MNIAKIVDRLSEIKTVKQALADEAEKLEEILKSEAEKLYDGEFSKSVCFYGSKSNSSATVTCRKDVALFNTTDEQQLRKFFGETE